MNNPPITYLKDYQPPVFLIPETHLAFDLYETHTDVKATLQIKRNPASSDSTAPLILDGENMQLKTVYLDDTLLSPEHYQLTATQLIIPDVPDSFMLHTEVVIKPQENLRLSGLYKTGNNFCTQCESHGFRRITYFLDRPDVLSRFITEISADKIKYPVLLSNGNLVNTDKNVSGGERHTVTWQDPTLKPCYLFALVAGDFDAIEDSFTTQSGHQITLMLYTEKHKREQGFYAMTCLKEAMQWDEEKYGREYDLDIFMTVAVSDFNFGAMENKGLNIFNDRYILADPNTATDDDFIAIKTVVGHEYFHNWSGNRVTVRDWFQITLKEGLTVFRDQQFTADKTSAVSKRIQEAKNIRNLQFVQDASPMAHPIYPDSYIEINNFYTVTVYEKGAEVIRMIHTLLGEKAFHKAMDLYFARHDGHPATTSDFVKAMQDSSGVDFSQFWRWYKQAGTPVVTVQDNYDAATQTYTLQITQSCPALTSSNAPLSNEHTFMIPLLMGLLDKNGHEVLSNHLLIIKDSTQTFTFPHITSKPIPSLLRHFSAPVKLIYPYTEGDYLFLLSHDTDLFNRWDAAQQLATRILLGCIKNIQNKQNCAEPKDFLNALKNILIDKHLDPAVIAEILTLPSEIYLLEQLPVADVETVHVAREWLKKQIAIALKDELFHYYEANAAVIPYHLNRQAIATRKLKNIALQYLVLLDNPNMNLLALKQFNTANNMTDMMGALLALNNIDCPERQTALNEFYDRWQNNPLVVQKWFTCQAQSTLSDTLAVVKKLTEHPAFDIKNPNRTRALIGAFASGNPVRFHDISGAGYNFLTDHILMIDKFNPQLAARIIEPLIHWKKFDPSRQALMKAALERIANTKPLSNDLYEVVSKSL